MRIAVLSDVHGNRTALRTVLSHARKTHGYDQVWFLGDVAGYNANPALCMRDLKQVVAPDCWVAGNHDRGVTEQLAPGYFKADAWWVLEKRHRVALRHHLDFLDALPSYRQSPVPGVWLVHGRASAYEIDNLTGGTSYIMPEDGNRALRSWHFLSEQSKSPSLILAGHTHHPACLQYSEDSFCPIKYDIGQPVSIGDAPLWLNPGSVGQPRDGDPRAAYLLIDFAQSLIVFERIAYNIKGTQEKMREQGYPESLINRLERGK